MSLWRPLERELALWRDSGRVATLWCRDDDACRDSPALRRLLAIAQAHAVPVAVAAIPADTESSLEDAVRANPVTTIVQHGYAHRNHAPPEERSIELGAHRPLDVCIDELVAGRQRLAEIFGERFVAVLVPPWNRIHAEVATALPAAGLTALSTFGPRTSPSPVAGLLQSNVHVDVINWRAGRAFIGAERSIGRLVDQLQARRRGSVDPDEPTGLLTHHLDLHEDAWTFLDALFARTSAHCAVRWLDVKAVFGPAVAADAATRSVRSA